MLDRMHVTETAPVVTNAHTITFIAMLQSTILMIVYVPVGPDVAVPPLALSAPVAAQQLLSPAGSPRQPAGPPS